MERSGKLFIVSAPSGVGKTPLVNAFLQRVSSLYPIKRIVTYTTKPRRVGEDRDGIDYHFLSPENFEQKIEKGFFLEWSDVYGHYYGSPLYTLDEIFQGDSRILVIDRNGAQQVIKKTADAVLLWIYVKNMQEIEKRLLLRGTETEEQVKERLCIAKRELDSEINNPFYNYHVLNDQFNEAVLEIERIFFAETGLRSIR